MNALVLRENSLAVEDIPTPECPTGWSRLHVLCAALNHRDQYIREGKYARIQLPAVLGSDVCAHLVPRDARNDIAVPRSPRNDIAPSSFSGERVVVDPSFGWGADPRAQGKDFHILGMPTQGGFAEELCVPDENIHPAPSHLTDEECAALPLAGVTAYRALMRKGACTAHDVVVITGIGGGVATMAATFALALGCKVIVTSRSQAKIDRVLERITSPNITGVVTDAEGAWVSTLKKHAPTLVVDSIGGDMVNSYMDALVPGGRIAMYGTSKGEAPSFNLHRLYWKQITLIGSTMGTSQDFADMLHFVNTHKIAPIIDRVYTLEEGADAFDRMKNAEQIGKIIIRIDGRLTKDEGR
jgi:zinc-binding alcohol dehydrogenase/oxidoreductase